MTKTSGLTLAAAGWTINAWVARIDDGDSCLGTGNDSTAFPKIWTLTPPQCVSEMMLRFSEAGNM